MQQDVALMIRMIIDDELQDVAPDDMQQDVALMIRMIIDDELQDVAPDDMQQDVAVMMIRTIMSTSG
jgi:hypothetical protein